MTGQDLFEKTINLCGLKAALTDAPTDVSDLSERALELINILLAENSILDCRIRKVQHEILSISELDDALPCEDIISLTVLPFGLARLFMLGEDDEFSREMERIYEANKITALKFGKAKHQSIREVYS